RQRAVDVLFQGFVYVRPALAFGLAGLDLGRRDGEQRRLQDRAHEGDAEREQHVDDEHGHGAAPMAASSTRAPAAATGDTQARAPKPASMKPARMEGAAAAAASRDSNQANMA